jgi:hypothetical protein
VLHSLITCCSNSARCVSSEPLAALAGGEKRRLVSNGVRTIIVESPDRFARDLAVQLADQRPPA